MDVSHYPRFKEDLMPNYICALASQLVLVQNSNIASPDKETLKEGNGNPIITEIKTGESQFNATSIPSLSDQRMATINEKNPSRLYSRKGASDDQDELHPPQSTVGKLGQQHSF